MTTKQCKCKYHEGDRQVPITEMTKDASRPDGYSNTCKSCARARKKSWLDRVYSGDPNVQSVEESRAKQNAGNKRSRKQKGLAWCLWKSAKDRCKRNGREFTITVDDVIIPNTCPIFGMPLIQEVVVHRNTSERPANYPTIDRIDSSRGYTPDNIIIISWRANSLKNDATLDELIALGEFAHCQRRGGNLSKKAKNCPMQPRIATMTKAGATKANFHHGSGPPYLLPMFLMMYAHDIKVHNISKIHHIL